MKTPRIRLLGLGCLVSLVLGGTGGSAAAPSDAVAETPRHPPIKLMSFNIRYGTAADGENHWSNRDALVLETIRLFAPDLIGLQEVLEFQAAFLRQHLAGYDFHGVGREDGSARGEYVPVMYRPERFARVDSGHFWLSESPDQAGSKSWDSSLPRMVSWVILRDRQAAARPFLFANTHFDHRGVQARIESAKLIRQRLSAIADGRPVILCGDFNVTEDDPPYAILTGAAAGPGLRFTDAYRQVHPQRLPHEATYSGWRGIREGSRIDWILTTPEFLPLDARINYTQERGRFPSDHYPVEAVLRLVEGAP